MKKRILLMLFVLLAGKVLGQTKGEGNLLAPNLKFGKPTTEELMLQSYAPDTAAVALILYDDTDVHYLMAGNKFMIESQCKVRIKVLKPDGVEYANIVFPYHENDKNKEQKEVISHIKATTYNMEDGKLVKTQMESNMVFRERVNENTMLLKFSVPKVKVGSVVEYQFVKQSDFFYNIDTWYAQQDVPVLYARYTLEIPEWFQFHVTQTGWSEMESKHEKGSVSLSVGSGYANVTSDKYTFTAQNIPAMRPDNFIWSMRDFQDKVSAELIGVEMPGRPFMYYTNTWESVDKMLKDHEDFGGRLKRSSPYKDEIAATGIERIQNTRERAAAVFDLLKKHLKWNGEYKLMGKSASKVIKEGSGSNADLNFILINMLNEVGLEAYPVVISTRGHGRILISHPSLDKLNTFVVGVMESDSTMMFLDASIEDGYVDALPQSLLTEDARALIPSGSTWVNLQQAGNNWSTGSINGVLDADGVITGTGTFTYEGLDAARMRREFRTAKDSVTFVADMDNRNSYTITDYHLEGHRGITPKVEEVITFSQENASTDDHIYFNPLIMPPFTESPFHDETRRLPIELPNRQRISFRTSVVLPDGYEVEEIPAALSLHTEDKGLVCRVVNQEQDGIVFSSYTFIVNKLFFTPDDYQIVKQFYDLLAEKSNEMVVLKKL